MFLKESWKNSSTSVCTWNQNTSKFITHCLSINLFSWSVTYIGRTKRHVVLRKRERMSPLPSSAVFNNVAVRNYTEFHNFEVLHKWVRFIYNGRLIHPREKPKLNTILAGKELRLKIPFNSKCQYSSTINIDLKIKLKLKLYGRRLWGLYVRAMS